MGHYLRLALAALAFFWAVPASAQCTGVFPPATLCGNLGATPAPPAPFASGGAVVGPGSSTIGWFAIWANATGTQLGEFNLFGTANNWTQAQTFSSLIATTADINGGTIDNTAIGGTTPAAAAVTTLSATGASTLAAVSGTTGTFSGALQGTALTLTTTPLAVASGGTGNASATANTIPLNNGTSAQGAVAVGAAGSCLQSQGAAPAFQTGGCKVLLATYTASTSATLGATNIFTSTYQYYDIVIENILAATANTQPQLQIYSGGSYQTTGYLNQGILQYASGSTSWVNLLTTAMMLAYDGAANATYGLSTTEVYNATITLQGPATSKKTIFRVNSYYIGAGGGLFGAIGSGVWNTADVITGFRFQMLSGNITSGTVKVYGYN